MSDFEAGAMFSGLGGALLAVTDNLPGYLGAFALSMLALRRFWRVIAS